MLSLKYFKNDCSEASDSLTIAEKGSIKGQHLKMKITSQKSIHVKYQNSQMQQYLHEYGVTEHIRFFPAVSLQKSWDVQNIECYPPSHPLPPQEAALKMSRSTKGPKQFWS